MFAQVSFSKSLVADTRDGLTIECQSTSCGAIWGPFGQVARTPVGGHGKLPGDGHEVARWRT